MSGGVQIERPGYLRPTELWAALSEHEKSTGMGPNVQDGFCVDALRAMSYEPFENATLHPANWKKLNAAIDVVVRLTGKGRLAIDVSPAREQYTVYPGGLLFEEFSRFPCPEGRPTHPVITVFELELEELSAELRDPEMTVDIEAATRRKLVFGCYEQVLKRLAMHFTVRVLTALVCLGTESRLMIRKMTLPDNPVERANLLTGAQDIRWHRKYLALCEAVSVDPDELLAFFKSSLLPLPGDDRPAVLRQYLGKPRHPEYQRRRQSDDTIPSLFRALTVLASPQLYPPLVGHPSEVVETHLRRVLRSAQWNGLEAIAKQYGLEVVDVLEMLRMHYPGVLIKAVTEPSKLRLELEYFVTERPDMATTIEFLWQRIMELLGREWDLHSSSPPGVRRRKLALLCELSNFDALMEWAQKFAPEMNPWLHSLSQL